MVKIKTTLIALLSLLLLSSLAFAAPELQEDSVTVDVDYRDFDTEDQTTIQEQMTFVINNPDTTDATVKVAVEGLPTGYSAETIPDVNVTNGSTQTVTFNLNVTHKEAPGTRNIGSIVIRDQNNTVLDRADLIQNTAAMLIIKEIEIDYVDDEGDDRDEEFNAETTNEFTLDRDVRPGSEIRLRFEIENRFRDEDYEESEIENIELTIDADDSDIFPRGFDEEYEFDDLQAKEKQELVVSWTIPQDVDAGDYRLQFILEGEDGENVKYTVNKEIRLELRRARDDVRITRTVISPASLTTCDAGFSLDVELKNFGTDDQDRAGFAVFNSELGINENIADIELEEFDDRGDTWRRTFQFTLPEDVRAKTYRLDLIPFIDRTEQINEEFLNVAIGQCQEQEETTTPPASNNEDTNNDDTQETTDTQPTTGTANNQDRTTTTGTQGKTTTVVQSVEDPYTTEDVLIAMLIVGIVIIVSIITLFIVLLVRK